MALSLKQDQIVHSKCDAILVKASAGSGKTRVLTERVRYLSDKTKRKLLAVTFTNKAAKEMEVRLSDVKDKHERLFIGTFHKFCQSVLENHGSLMGFSKMPHIFEEEADRLKLVEQAIFQTPSALQKYQQESVKVQRRLCSEVLDFVSKVKRNLDSEDNLLNKTDSQDMVLLYENYQDLLLSQHAIDFDDLLSLTYQLLTDFPTVSSLYRRSYQYIFIDEAQDLNYAQYQVLLALTNGEHKKVMMVGDPNQSIYAFNGSSPAYMTDHFCRDFAPEVIELKQNFRSSKAVIEVAERVMPGSSEQLNTFFQGGFELFPADDENAEAEWVVQKIIDLIEMGQHDDIEGTITGEKIAILARNKYIFKPLEALLYEKQIPFYYNMTPGTLKYESVAMKIFDMAFRVKLNQQDRLHWQRLLDLLHCTSKAQGDLNNLISQLSSGIYREILEIVINLNANGDNLKKLLTDFLEDLKVSTAIEQEDEKKMIFNDIDALLTHWRNYAKKTDHKDLHHFRNAMALGQTHPLTQHKGITLSTVHTMKGQEFDIVFLLGMDDGTFPDYRAVKRGGIEMTQEKNNLYVAITRAKRFLYGSWPKKRWMPWEEYQHRKICRWLR